MLGTHTMNRYDGFSFVWSLEILGAYLKKRLTLELIQVDETVFSVACSKILHKPTLEHISSGYK